MGVAAARLNLFLVAFALPYALGAATLTCSIDPSVNGTCSISGPLDYAAEVNAGPNAVSLYLTVFPDANFDPSSPSADTLSVQFELPSDSGDYVGEQTAGWNFLSGGPDSLIFSSEPGGQGTIYGAACCTVGETDAFSFSHAYGDPIYVDATVQVADIFAGENNSGLLVASFVDPAPAPEPTTIGLALLASAVLATAALYRVNRGAKAEEAAGTPDSERRAEAPVPTER